LLSRESPAPALRHRESGVGAYALRLDAALDDARADASVTAGRRPATE